MDRSQAIQTILTKTVILSPNVTVGTFKEVYEGYTVGTQTATEPSFSVTINGQERLVTKEDFEATYQTAGNFCMKIAPQRMIPIENFRDEEFREIFNSLIADRTIWEVGPQFVKTKEQPQDWTIRQVIAYSAQLSDTGQWEIIRVYPISASGVERNYPFDYQKL